VGWRVIALYRVGHSNLISHLMPEIMALAIFGAVIMTAAALRFRKRLD